MGHGGAGRHVFDDSGACCFASGGDSDSDCSGVSSFSIGGMRSDRRFGKSRALDPMDSVAIGKNWTGNHLLTFPAAIVIPLKS